MTALYAVGKGPTLPPNSPRFFSFAAIPSTRNERIEFFFFLYVGSSIYMTGTIPAYLSPFAYPPLQGFI